MAPSSLLVQAEVDGAPISDDVMLQILYLVLVGGVDTTTSLIANGLRWLGQHTDVRQRLSEDPELLPLAREEMLRYFTPTQGLPGRSRVTPPSQVYRCESETGCSCPLPPPTAIRMRSPTRRN